MRKITALLLALVMALALLPVTASAEDSHTHCLCGATHNAVGDHTAAVETTFQKWDNATSLPTTSGSYYLDTDVTMSSDWRVMQNITLCLNGHKITFASGKRVWALAESAKLVLTDCQGDGMISADGCDVGFVSAMPHGEFTMYGGTIKGNGQKNGVRADTSGKINLYGGTITDYDYGVYLKGGDAAKCQFKMYGGTITNCTVAGVYNERGSVSTIYMYGGEIKGNNGVGIHGNCLHMYGGTVSGNNGGGIKDNTKYLYGGTVIGNNKFGVSSAGEFLNLCGTNKLVIKDNYSDGVKNPVTGLYEGTIQCNLSLYGRVRTITGKTFYIFIDERDLDKVLNTSSQIGITCDRTPTATEPVDITIASYQDFVPGSNTRTDASTGAASKDYSAAFFSDNPDYFIINQYATGWRQNVVQLGLLIKNVNATAAAPAIGQPLDTTAVLPEGVNYVADAVVWYEGTDATGEPFTGSAGEETSYTAKITLTLASAVRNTMRFAQGDALTIPEGYTLVSSDGTTVVLKKTFTTGKLPLAETAVASGSTAGGQTLTATLEGGNSESLTYQWFRETAAGSGVYVAIPGATGKTYTTTAEDVGLNLRVEISATDREGTKTSQPVGPITSLPAPDSGSGAEDGTTPPAGDAPVSGGHTPIRRQNTTTADAAIGTATGDSNGAGTVTSAKTFDAGAAVYGGMMACAALGLGYALRRRRCGR